MITQNNYLFEPMSQNRVPNIKALIAVKYNLMVLYAGILQYTRFCFHKHRKNWLNKFCEYVVSNVSGSESAGGCPYCKIEDSTPLRKTLRSLYFLCSVDKPELSGIPTKACLKVSSSTSFITCSTNSCRIFQ